MATNKIIKKSTRCKSCGKTVSHGENDPAYDLCYTCREITNNDDFELQLWYQMVGIVSSSHSVKEK